MRLHRAFLILVVAFCACASESRHAPPLVVASDLDNRPFAFVGDGGRPSGRDVEMMEQIAREIGRPIEWKRMPFEQLIDAVAEGRADVVCATLGVSPERGERVRFSTPYFETRIAVVTLAAPTAPRTLRDLDGKRVSAGIGTTSAAAVEAALPRAIGVYENKAKLPVLERLQSGEIAAAVLDGPNADALQRDHPDELRVLSEPLAPERYALAVGLEGAALADALDAAIARLQSNGWMRDLDARWGL